MGGDAREATAKEGGYVSYPEPVHGPKVRARSETFADYNSQARLFWNSMSDPEKTHIVQALQFELAKVSTREIQERMVKLLADVDRTLADAVAKDIGLVAPAGKVPNIGAAPGLSQIDSRRTAATRKVAILAADGVSASDVAGMKAALSAAGVHFEVIAPHTGVVTATDGSSIAVDQRLRDVRSVLYGEGTQLLEKALVA